jgi:hypothetical protein
LIFKLSSVMKRLVKPLALLFCLAAVMSCSKKVESVQVDPVIVNPISDFKVTPDPTDGFTFKFENLSKTYKTIEWRFGDDTLNTTVSPTHTYLSTGKYTTDLKTISATGNISHKYVDINLVPDEILAVTTAKTNVPLELQFTAVLKGTVKTIHWTFNKVDPSNSQTTVVTSEELNPKESFLFGSFNNFTVTAVTDKGSTVSISKSVTTDGLATDITQARVSYKSSNENTDQGPNEGSLKLVDGNTTTKFGFYKAFPVPEIATFEFAAPVVVKLYAIENGNDSGSDRDPKEWYLEGTNDQNATWTALDHITLTKGFADYLSSIGQGSTQYLRFFYYPIAHPQAFKYYRWRIVSVFNNAFQIEEFRLYK